MAVKWQIWSGYVCIKNKPLLPFEGEKLCFIHNEMWLAETLLCAKGQWNTISAAQTLKF